MKRAPPDRAGDVPDGTNIDALYGLEPVFEPGAAPGAAGLGEFVAVVCPYCGESFHTPVDLTAGSFSYVEDCQICCQPIELDGRLAEDGTLVSLVVRRLD
ncbi:MAG TPA: CPXCG motif-containing cysteine-rich protein [Steroidobacteraceae bacterium]|nr:CPXCG motif-containing cysteine-rich protein [Steroidobacteraceae bacterium]